MAKDQGFSDKDCEVMIAHLYHECGSMSEDCGWEEGSLKSDAGLAIGIAQWHVCYRYSDWMKKNKFGCPHGQPKKASKIRKKFFEDFPEMKDWRNQAMKYISEMKACTKKRSLKACVDSWNANPKYLSMVYGKISKAKTLLN